MTLKDKETREYCIVIFGAFFLLIAFAYLTADVPFLNLGTKVNCVCLEE